ncbi:MAG: CPBP family intramembrane glutamic endopeptidase [Gaiellaceae bacterium]
MNDRSATTPHGMDDRRRLALWLALVAFFIALQYLGRTEGGPSGDPLYSWSFAIGSVVQEAVVLAIVLALAGFSLDRLALRLPERRWRALGLLIAAFVAIQVFGFVYSAIAHPGNEQGLTPDRWEPRHAAAYIVNAAIICTLVPVTEELTFRGLGYSLLRPYGKWLAILGVGLLFGLSHGLLVSLPVLVFFGCALAWVREQTDSVVPGMIVHGAFNLIALVLAVTAQG